MRWRPIPFHRKNFEKPLDFLQNRDIIKRLVIAELCKGSTTDSDSVCEGSNPSSAATSEQSTLCSDFLFQRKLSAAPLLLLLRKKSRSHRLTACKVPFSSRFALYQLFAAAPVGADLFCLSSQKETTVFVRKLSFLFLLFSLVMDRKQRNIFVCFLLSLYDCNFLNK